MTKTQLKLAARLLSMAGGKFGNHGCNDLWLKRDVGLTDDEISEVEAGLRKHDDEVNFGDHVPIEGELASDFVLMFWLARVAEMEAGEGVSES